MKNNEFKSSDLYFSAYLQTAGVELKRTERQENGKVFFVFDATVSNIDELKAAWFNHTGKVVANLYAYNLKTLKSLCHMK